MKKLLSIIFALIMVSIQLSCSKAAESQLYVIDSIKLGNTMTDYEIQMGEKISLSTKPGRSLNRLQFVTQQFVNPAESSDFMILQESKHIW